MNVVDAITGLAGQAGSIVVVDIARSRIEKVQRVDDELRFPRESVAAFGTDEN